jgi:hypothetical protein
MKRDPLSLDALLEEKRINKYLEDLIKNKKRTPITQSEVFLSSNSDRIQALDMDISGKLIEILNHTSGLVRTVDATSFLLASTTVGKLDEAYETLEVIAARRLTVSGKDLRQILKDSDDMPLSWAVTLLGSEDDEDDEPVIPVNKSSIDLDRLHSFK